MDQANPEFKKLAFTAPGPKNAFAPLKRSDYIEKRKTSVTSSEEDGESEGVGKALGVVKRGTGKKKKFMLCFGISGQIWMSLVFIVA